MNIKEIALLSGNVETPTKSEAHLVLIDIIKHYEVAETVPDELAKLYNYFKPKVRKYKSKLAWLESALVKHIKHIEPRYTMFYNDGKNISASSGTVFLQANIEMVISIEMVDRFKDKPCYFNKNLSQVDHDVPYMDVNRIIPKTDNSVNITWFKDWISHSLIKPISTNSCGVFIDNSELSMSFNLNDLNNTLSGFSDNAIVKFSRNEQKILIEEQGMMAIIPQIRMNIE